MSLHFTFMVLYAIFVVISLVIPVISVISVNRHTGFFMSCSRISLVPKVQRYLKSKCPVQICIQAGCSATLSSRYIDRISLEEVCNSVC